MAFNEDDIYRAQAKLYQQNYDNTAKLAKKNYESGAGIANKTADNAILNTNKNTDLGLQQAYIGKMQDQRNFGQKMARLGYTGGASETSLLGMENQYRGDRAGLEKGRINANNETELQRQRDLAGLYQAYNTALMNAYSGYANNMAGAMSGLASRNQAADALAAQQEAAAAAATAKAGNGGGGSGGNTVPVPKYTPAIDTTQAEQMVYRYKNLGSPKQLAINTLASYGMSDQDINKILKKYYG